jgi:GTP-binding protein EngB required for normal cell division
VIRAIDAAGALVDVSALERAWAHRAQGPVHLMVVGRRSVGKSCLVNALVGAAVCDVGLGGVTRAAARYEGHGVVVWDTPALENALDGADLIESHLPSLDAMVWLVDGLQPLTSLEREAFDDAVGNDVGVHMLISRFDLLGPLDRQGVLERVRELTRHRAPLSVTSVDPRRPEAAALQALGVVHPERSPRRRAALRSALDDVGTALSYLPAPIDLDLEHRRIVDAWREAAREVLERTRQQVKAGELLFRDQAVKALAMGLKEAAAVIADRERPAFGGAASWRVTDVDELDLWGQTADLLGGESRVLKALDDVIIAEVTAGERAWTELFEGPVGSALRRRQRARLDAMEAVQMARSVC